MKDGGRRESVFIFHLVFDIFHLPFSLEVPPLGGSFAAPMTNHHLEGGTPNKANDR